MDLVALHMDFPLVVHVMDSSFRVVVLLADRLEQFLRLLLILVGDVQEVVAQEAHLELVSSNLLVVVSVYSEFIKLLLINTNKTLNYLLGIAKHSSWWRF